MRMSQEATATMLVVIAGGVNILRDGVLLILAPLGVHLHVGPAIGSWHP